MTPVLSIGVSISRFPDFRFFWGSLELQPAFERGFHFANDTSIKLSGSFVNELGELHRLDALDVDVAMLPQPLRSFDVLHVANPCVVLKRY